MRQTMIDNRTAFLMRDNPALPAHLAHELSTHLQAAYERNDWDRFDLIRDIAESYTHADPNHLPTNHEEECTCPF